MSRELYYFEQESDDIATIELNHARPGVQRDSDNNIVRNDSWAVFTQWTYDFNDRLEPHGGRPRYTEDTKPIDSGSIRSFGIADYQTAPGTALQGQPSQDFTPSAVALNFRWSDTGQ